MRNGKHFIFPHSLIKERSENLPDLRSLKLKFRQTRYLGTDAEINSWKLHIDPLRSIVKCNHKYFWRLGDMTYPGNLAWPELVPKIIQNVGNKCPLVVRKFQLTISSFLTITHEKPERGLLTRPPPTPTIGLNDHKSEIVSNFSNRTVC